jgi:tetratricopeptide (TPR) repeat protein
MFRRVLSADPEEPVAYAGLGAIYEERGLVEEAIWQMERAMELSPRNAEIRRALRNLYEKRGGLHSRRVKMTRGALARGYMRGHLYPKAIGEIRDIVQAHPHRLDLRVALAQALWHDRREQDAAAVCQGILDDLPNCLKACLMLGQVWLNSDKDERARSLLQVCQTLDPDNEVAQNLLGPRSPLPLRVARIPYQQGELPPLDLPYLYGDDRPEGPVRGRIGDTIDGQGTVIAPKRPSLPKPEAPPDRAPTASKPGATGEPHIAQADLGLDQARRLRDEGLVGAALDGYESVIERYPELRAQVADDLDLLQTLYPANKRIVNLLHKLQTS